MGDLHPICETGECRDCAGTTPSGVTCACPCHIYQSVTVWMVEQQVKRSFTNKGVKQWWERPRYQLDGKTPRQAWYAGEHQKVYDLAVAGNASEAT